ncbi:MAG TPA: hypothetical protein VFM97_00275 [Gammaproteobacteria bacterium]|nr:hypothetical protein [Gammaproteobacteria bacterium]
MPPNSLENELILSELREVKQGMKAVYEALERLAKNEQSVSRAQEDIRQLFKLHEATAKETAAALERLREQQDRKIERQGERVGVLETAVSRLGGNIKLQRSIGTWLANNGAALAIALISSGFAAWLAVFLVK